MKTLKKVLIGFSILIFLFVINIYALDLSKIDPKLRMLMEDPQLNKHIYFQRYGIAKPESSPYTNVIIKTSASITTLESTGAEIRAIIGDIVTATIKIDRLPNLAQLPEVMYIQAPGFLQPHTDVSVPETRAPLVRQYYGVSGSGVIIGIIDTGIDWQHEDFLVNGKTRIKYLLDLSDPGDEDGDGSLDGPKDTYGGTLYTEQEINNALSGSGTIPADDVVGHGTHVAGCAAGNGSGTGKGIAAGTYVGVAPKADLVIVKATRVQGSRGFYSDDYISALKFIDSIAKNLGKPYVANMSLGSNEGPHDGTLLEEQAINTLVGAGIPGKVVVVSAGNDGNHAIHTSGEFTNSIASVETKLKIDDYTTNDSNYDDYLSFEIWYDGHVSHSIKLTAPDGTAYGPVDRGSEINRRSENGAVRISNAVGGKNPVNGDNQAIIIIFDSEANKPPASGEWIITIKGTSGRFDMWLYDASMGDSAYFISNVDESMLIATPATAKNAITVGSYVTKNQWIDLDGKGISPVPKPELHTASSFSSQGPTRDWRTKPEIVAPGEWIISSYSQDAPPDGEYSLFNTQNEDIPNGFISRDGKHALAQGTSMSAPHVAGVVALMLEKDRTLDASQIKEALIVATKRDEYTLSVPNNKWGYGKLDAYAAMQYITGQSQEKKMTLSLFQNPALTQYIDFYLITQKSLQSMPTATIEVGSSSPVTINMSEMGSLVYKGEYQFSSDGTVKFTVKATIKGESETTLIKYFGIQLLKPNLGGTVAFDKVNLSISKNSFHRDTYFTIFPVEKDATVQGLQPIGKAYQFGPSNYSFEKAIVLTFNYDAEIVTELDEYKLGIYVLEDSNWKRLKSTIDVDRNTVNTTIDRLSIFRLFYNPDTKLTENLPPTFKLYQNFPNPFNAHTSIAYYLAHNAQISIKIFNIKGEYITTLFEGAKQAGFHKILWDARNLKNQPLASELYFCRFSTDNYSISQKMLLLK